jgi:hypothetical protein
MLIQGTALATTTNRYDTTWAQANIGVAGFTENTQDNSSISAGYNGTCINGEYG